MPMPMPILEQSVMLPLLVADDADGKRVLGRAIVGSKIEEEEEEEWLFVPRGGEGRGGGLEFEY
jgi:hypothetical protein